MNSITLFRRRRLATVLAAGLAAFFSLGLPQASAQITGAKVVAKGMACPFCAYGVEKKLGAVKGVTDVTVEMKTGTANLTFTKESSLDLVALRHAIRAAGFTMGAVSVSAVGSITKTDDGFFLVVRETEQTFRLSAPTSAAKNAQEGPTPNPLTGVTEAGLRKLIDDHATVKLSGLVEARDGAPTALRVETWEVVK